MEESSVQTEEPSVLTAKANRLIEIPDCLFQLPATYARLEWSYSIWSARLEWQRLFNKLTITNIKSRL